MGVDLRRSNKGFCQMANAKRLLLPCVCRYIRDIPVIYVDAFSLCDLDRLRLVLSEQVHLHFVAHHDHMDGA